MNTAEMMPLAGRGETLFQGIFRSQMTILHADDNATFGNNPENVVRQNYREGDATVSQLKLCHFIVTHDVLPRKKEIIMSKSKSITLVHKTKNQCALLNRRREHTINTIQECLLCTISTRQSSLLHRLS